MAPVASPVHPPQMVQRYARQPPVRSSSATSGVYPASDQLGLTITVHSIEPRPASHEVCPNDTNDRRKD